MAGQPTITDVMRAHAEHAVAYARNRFRMELDYSSQSLERVDRMLAAMYYDIPRTTLKKLLGKGLSHEQVNEYSKMWGGYIGETIRRKWGGNWKSSLRADGHAQIALDLMGHRYLPVDECRRRIVEGRPHGKGGVMDLYQQVIEDMAAVTTATPTPVAPPPPRRMDPIPPSAPLVTRRPSVTDVLGVEPEDLEPLPPPPARLPQSNNTPGTPVP